MNWLFARLREPSTFAGLSGIVAGFLPFFHGGAANTVSVIAQSLAGVATAPSPIGLGVAALGALGVLMSEKGKN